MRSTITHALAALLVGAATAAAALAADSTGIGLPDVPWQKPWARTADALQGMPTSCPEGQVLTVGVNGAFSCVEANSSTNVNQCSASVTLLGGKTQQQCCNAGGNVVSTGGGNSICKFSGASCPVGWNVYGNWTTTQSGSCFGPSFFENESTCVGSGLVSTGGHAFSNVAPEVVGYTVCPFAHTEYCRASVVERGCI